jgi:hypothetical protein
MSHPIIESHPRYRAWFEEDRRLRHEADEAQQRLAGVDWANREAEQRWQTDVTQARHEGLPDPPSPAPARTDYLAEEVRGAMHNVQRHRETRGQMLASIAAELLPELRKTWTGLVEEARPALDTIDALATRATQVVSGITELLSAVEHADPNRQQMQGPSVQIGHVDREQFIAAIRGIDPLAPMDPRPTPSSRHQDDEEVFASRVG